MMKISNPHPVCTDDNASVNPNPHKNFNEPVVLKNILKYQGFLKIY